MATKRTSKAWPAPLNKRVEPELPAWDHHDLYPHGIFPMRDKPEEFNEEKFQDYGRKLARHFEECDRVKNDEKGRLLQVLLQVLGTNDYKEALLRLAERCVPAFQEPQKRGAKLGKEFIRLVKLHAAVEEIQRHNPDINDTEALQLHNPELMSKKPEARKKLEKQRQYLSKARGIYRQIRTGS